MNGKLTVYFLEESDILLCSSSSDPESKLISMTLDSSSLSECTSMIPDDSSVTMLDSEDSVDSILLKSQRLMSGARILGRN